MSQITGRIPPTFPRLWFDRLHQDQSEIFQNVTSLTWLTLPVSGFIPQLAIAAI